MLSKGIVLLVITLTISISFTSVFALTELERASISDPRLETSLGGALGNDVNVDQQFQISADITNHQDKSQNFVYLVQVKDKTGFVVYVAWITGQLTPDQKFGAARSWTPNEPGEFTVEIFVWEGIVNHNALCEHTTLQINVS